VAKLGGLPQRSSNVETWDTHRDNPLEMKLTTSRNILVVKLALFLKGKERYESIPKFMTLKSSRKPNHPLSI
jgi:hypothetical protein